MTNPNALCADCQSIAATLTVRHRRLCNTCFAKYISSKILKRMDSFRFKNQIGKKRLLLPLSGGVSSLVLLEVLHQQLQRQLRQQGRTAYDIVIGHIDIGCGSGSGSGSVVSRQPSTTQEWWKRVEEQFGGLHGYLPVFSFSQICTYDAQVEEDLSLLGIRRAESEGAEQFIARVISLARSVTARSDLQELLLRRFLVAVAKQQNCDGVVWGHSDSRLAAKALSEVAKGRGGAVSNDLADGLSPWGLDFNYPQRDLFESELKMYLDQLTVDVQSCYLGDGESEEIPVSLRMTSIDRLLNNYITSQGVKYPSIMANVVRTVSKLQVPSAADVKICRFCAMPITVAGEDLVLCYGCERMKKDISN